ncbi:MAG: OmpA family protein [Alphaproteobacteria bacterium]|nr:OmpA family protein [Alphaproteobacteria bacterium]
MSEPSSSPGERAPLAAVEVTPAEPTAAVTPDAPADPNLFPGEDAAVVAAPVRSTRPRPRLALPFDVSADPRGGFGASVGAWLVIAVLTLVGAHSCAPAQVEARLKRQVEVALRDAGVGYVTVGMRGQTVVLGGVAPSADAKSTAGAAALRAAGPGGAWSGGVTRVENQIVIGAPVSPYTWSATRDGTAVRLKGHAPSPTARAALAARAKALFGTVIDETAVAPGAPPEQAWQAVASDALGRLASLKSGAVRLSDRRLTILGEADPAAAAELRTFYAQPMAEGFSALLDVTAPGQALDVPGVSGVKLTANAAADTCQKAFAGLLSRNVINFDTGSAEVSASSQQILDDLGRVARRCDQYSIEIAGHTDDRGDRAANMKLSRARAEAVVRYLVGLGVAPERLEAAGFGPDRPRASNASAAGQAQNRRIEFTVKS